MFLPNNDPPTSPRYIYEPFRYFAEMSSSAPFPIHSLLPDFQNSSDKDLTWAEDPHYNEAGHRLAAEAITRYLVADGLLANRPPPTPSQENINP